MTNITKSVLVATPDGATRKPSEKHKCYFHQ